MPNYENIKREINHHAAIIFSCVKHLPEYREVAVAQTHFDTAMLWLRQAFEAIQETEAPEAGEPSDGDARDTEALYTYAEVLKLMDEVRDTERKRLARAIYNDRIEPSTTEPAE